MTKREEMREEVARRIAIRDDRGFLDHSTLKYKISVEQYEFTDRILKGLHSQGVVIKVDGELPERASLAIAEGGTSVIIPLPALINLGYTKVEPLIKDGQH